MITQVVMEGNTTRINGFIIQLWQVFYQAQTHVRTVTLLLFYLHPGIIDIFGIP